MPINDEKEEDDLWEEFKKTKSPALRDMKLQHIF